MKLLLSICLSLLALTAHAQVAGAGLANDPVFRTVLSRHVAYPIDAERQGIYATIYAGFAINSRGHVSDVQVLNPVKIGHGFEQEVVKTIKRLPPLHPKYQGQYAIPVVFAHINYNESPKPNRSTGRLPKWYFNDRTLLDEVVIVGSDRGQSRGSRKTYSLGQVDATN